MVPSPCEATAKLLCDGVGWGEAPAGGGAPRQSFTGRPGLPTGALVPDTCPLSDATCALHTVETVCKIQPGCPLTPPPCSPSCGHERAPRVYVT